ncbi:hypothetical protein AG0111_0g3849 [Alternaria gaisen]|uniref:Uncharacterized protein n=1 Tax=Alternaria gaisen TaxID=167740 RepID=A0ACB6FT69_9PLEO|nr:hypothetical protein AG0111_0g3849 [Alternaria gaisen]
MTRGPITCDTSLPKTPKTTLAPATPTTSVAPPKTPPSTKFPRNPSNKFWAQEQQRRLFLEHLKRWSLSHDSSTFFQGKISLLPPEPGVNEGLALGKTVTCILTDSSFTDFRKTVAIRLFNPQKNSKKGTTGHFERNMKSKSMDLFRSDMRLAEHHEDCYTREEDAWPLSPSKLNPSTSYYYKLVIRYGSGWLSARDYLNKLYFSHFAARFPGRNVDCVTGTADHFFGVRSKALGPPPCDRDTVPIQPLFHPFQRLPTELQEMILMTAVGLTRDCDLTNDPRRNCSNNPKASERPISLSTMLRISRHIYTTMQPYIFHSTTFHFGLSGTTNFLWQSGPVHRPQIRRLAFHFGKNALLHCVRWLAADPIFDLLEPPQPNGGSGLPLFWRCQLRALAKEVHLLELVVDIEGIPKADIAMVVRILRGVFGSVERVRFVDGAAPGKTEVVDKGDERLAGLGKGSWRDMVKGYIERYRRQIGWHNWHFKMDLVPLKEEEVDDLMDKEMEFFDS